MAVYTRNEIKTAFVLLLDERPFTKITVKDVVLKCGVNRNTFYYYFRDLPDLVTTISVIFRIWRKQLSKKIMARSQRAAWISIRSENVWMPVSDLPWSTGMRLCIFIAQQTGNGLYYPQEGFVTALQNNT